MEALSAARETVVLYCSLPFKNANCDGDIYQADIDQVNMGTKQGGEGFCSSKRFTQEAVSELRLAGARAAQRRRDFRRRVSGENVMILCLSRAWLCSPSKSSPSNALRATECVLTLKRAQRSE